MQKDNTINQKVGKISKKLFRTKYKHLSEREKRVAHYLAERIPISRNVVKDFSEQLTFGQRIADKIATFGSSWAFISIFVVVLIIWVLLNSFVLVEFDKLFDPYLYILLNLFYLCLPPFKLQ
ncbi:putative membrane protein [Thermacetogenium phaeum DSM 12270]|uniref:Putative membrane protein n=1 Tax=Thermacetogenium phaeum (strain ATCC BAA-254 / DSM 26808 / PB) TaxID=1089553 RepID=K4LE19_THEPS|nr:putative membrane protein [Thermacetogenium phaeum DSM 12270]